MAFYLGEFSVTALLDAWKAFESVSPSALLDQSRPEGFPVLLTWMTLQYHLQPRTLKCHGSLSIWYRSAQGILAGCSMSTTMLTVLTAKAIRRLARDDIIPRALVDDVSAQW
eukprot:5773895-Pyramimonas_sp.AAC.1